MKKKKIALFMALAILMTSVQTPVSAAELMPDEEEIHQEAVVWEVPVDGTDAFEVEPMAPENAGAEEEVDLIIEDLVIFCVEPGETAELKVNAVVNVGSLSYQWYELTDDEDEEEVLIEGETSNTLTVSGVTACYKCLISDEYGNSDRAIFWVDVDTGLTIEDYDSDIYVALGGTAELEVNAAVNMGSLSYRWYELKWYGEEGYEKDFLIEDETSNTLTVSDITSQKEYWCEVRDEYGNSEWVYFYVYVDGDLTFECTHDWGTGVVTKAATCAETGIRTYACSKCMETRTEVIPKNNNHTWEDWKTTAAATVFSAEKQSRVCSVCKTKEERTVGEKLAPTIKLTAASLKMQQKQKTTKFKVTGLATGDYVKSWNSSNKKVLKVTGKKDGNCTLKAKKTGKAVITVTLASGLKKTVSVKVQKKQVKTTSIQGLSKNVKLKKGKKLKLEPTLNPITSQDKITYVSSNKKVAAVSAKGVVKAKKVGKAKITVKAGKKKFVIKVVVK